MAESLIVRRGGDGNAVVSGTFSGDAAVNGVLSLPDVAGKKAIFLMLAKSGSYSMSNLQVTAIAVNDDVVDAAYYSDWPSITQDHKCVTYDGNGNFTLSKSYSWTYGDWSTVWHYYAV